MLIEAAWSYRFPARTSREQLLRQEALPRSVRDIAWKAQMRLCGRYRKLSMAGKASRRMLALALVLDGRSRTAAAQSCGMDRQTLRDWVHRCNAEGLAGLFDPPLAWLPPRLSAGQMSEIAVIVETGPDPKTDGVVRWRRIDLCAVVERRFGIRVAERTMGSILRRLGFVRLSERPSYPQSDAEAQAVYKKTSPIWRARPCRTRCKASRWRSGSRCYEDRNHLEPDVEWLVTCHLGQCGGYRFEEAF